LLLVGFARLGGADDAGQFALALALTAPVFVTLELGLRAVYVTSNVDRPFAAYLRVRAAAMILAGLISVGIALIYPSGNPTVIVLVALTKMIDSTVDMSFAVFQRYGKVRTMALAVACNAVLTLILSMLAYALTRSLPLSIAGSALASIIAGYYLGLVPARALLRGERTFFADRTTDKSQQIAGIVRSGMVVGVSYGLASLTISIPNYALALRASVSEVAKFAILLYAVSAVELLLNSLVQSSMHNLVSIYRSQGPAVLAHYALIRSLRLSLVLGALAVPLAACLPSLLRGLLGEAFRVPELAILPLSIVILLMPFMFYAGAVVTVGNRYKSHLVASGMAALLSVAVATVTVPRSHMVGASLCLLTAVSVRTLVSAGTVKFLVLGRPAVARAMTLPDGKALDAVMGS